jgi:hypothetical protein
MMNAECGMMNEKQAAFHSSFRIHRFLLTPFAAPD